MKNNQLQIIEDEIGMRLERFLRQKFPYILRSKIFSAIRSGEVRVNKMRVDINSRLQINDIVRVPPQFLGERNTLQSQSSAIEQKTHLPNQKIYQEVKIIFEDEDLIVVNKPAGLACHGGTDISFGLLEYLRILYQQPKIELAHRLDKETSGVVILARRRIALRPLHQQFRERSIEKIYYARVFGSFPENIRKIDRPLLKHENEEKVKKVEVNPKGLPAVTLIECVAKEDFSLLKVIPLSGRTHQIRVHLQSVGFPIIGDNRYANFAMNREFAQKNLIKRMFLHSNTININHPLTLKQLSFCAELPAEFTKKVKT